MVDELEELLLRPGRAALAPRSSRISSGISRLSNRSSKPASLLGEKAARRWSSRSGTTTKSTGAPTSRRWLAMAAARWVLPSRSGPTTPANRAGRGHRPGRAHRHRAAHGGSPPACPRHQGGNRRTSSVPARRDRRPSAPPGTFGRQLRLVHRDGTTRSSSDRRPARRRPGNRGLCRWGRAQAWCVVRSAYSCSPAWAVCDLPASGRSTEPITSPTRFTAHPPL